MAKSLYIISYDLKVPGRDYSSLYDAIKTFDWQHPLESTWLVITEYSADEISKLLRKDGRMDDSDLLFVCRLDPKDRQGWLDKYVWVWIRNYLDNNYD